MRDLAEAVVRAVSEGQQELPPPPVVAIPGKRDGEETIIRLDLVAAIIFGERDVTLWGTGPNPVTLLKGSPGWNDVRDYADLLKGESAGP